MTASLIIDGPAGFDATGELCGLSSARRLITVFKLAGVSRTIISDSGNMDAVVHYCTKIGADYLLPRKKDAKGAEGRVLAALKYLPEKYTRLFITPCSFPLFETETVRRLCETDADIAVPEYNGERGYPVLISRRVMSKLKDCGGELDRFLSENSGSVLKLKTDDAGVVTDVSSGADVSELAARNSLHTKLRVKNKISVAREKNFFGPGVLQLILLVEETHSVSFSRKVMGMANSYTAKITQDAEQNLGFKLFSHYHNGHNGGRTDLTPECKRFTEQYRAFTADCDKYINEAFLKHFPDKN
jgi:molybdenum-dependent DNA-binding transcriptional regulator ModE/CTP:molybdopterin cytidylyltransferase MocA